MSSTFYCKATFNNLIPIVVKNIRNFKSRSRELRGVEEVISIFFSSSFQVCFKITFHFWISKVSYVDRSHVDNKFTTCQNAVGCENLSVLNRNGSCVSPPASLFASQLISEAAVVTL